jgi:hypothetical protein
MSTPSSWDDAAIHAYVDGVLDADAAARLEADSSSDAALAARIARQRELRASLKAEFDPVLDEPIPQRLRDALAGPGPSSVVAPIGTARKERAAATRPRWSLREWGAVAATLAFGVLVGSLLFRGSSSLPLETQRGRLVAAGDLDAALSTQLAGAAPQGAPARIGLSFRAADGEYCRTFSLEAGTSGLACRREGRWAVELLEGAAAQPAPPGNFRQASSALSPAMLGAIKALGAGEPLTTDEERQRIGSGWEAAGQ